MSQTDHETRSNSPAQQFKQAEGGADQGPVADTEPFNEAPESIWRRVLSVSQEDFLHDVEVAITGTEAGTLEAWVRWNEAHYPIGGPCHWASESSESKRRRDQRRRAGKDPRPMAHDLWTYRKMVLTDLGLPWSDLPTKGMMKAADGLGMDPEGDTAKNEGPDCTDPKGKGKEVIQDVVQQEDPTSDEGEASEEVPGYWNRRPGQAGRTEGSQGVPGRRAPRQAKPYERPTSEPRMTGPEVGMTPKPTARTARFAKTSAMQEQHKSSIRILDEHYQLVTEGIRQAQQERDWQRHQQLSATAAAIHAKIRWHYMMAERPEPLQLFTCLAMHITPYGSGARDMDTSP
ncbi:hypothetical protein CPC16_005192 [Podila verticillata]|nr:hypothetical protein CPC16_005192 [Podila verticillata]